MGRVRGDGRREAGRGEGMGDGRQGGAGGSFASVCARGGRDTGAKAGRELEYVALLFVKYALATKDWSHGIRYAAGAHERAGERSGEESGQESGRAKRAGRRAGGRRERAGERAGEDSR